MSPPSVTRCATAPLIELQCAIGDRYEESRGRHSLARLYVAHGRFVEALHELRASLALMEEHQIGLDRDTASALEAALLHALGAQATDRPTS